MYTLQKTEKKVGERLAKSEIEARVRAMLNKATKKRPVKGDAWEDVVVQEVKTLKQVLKLFE
jgi:hypothetical protein